ncbi:hypothetical protein ACH4S8_22555 [Streptomyces sp. NPDC021080]|uniref:hypothetical protein n=1 Tax=Streptomyces sp. NPDC021080 TaxID=3365110 RepID=UPI0037A6B167
MNEEYASAMVTVIPVVLLVASVEFSQIFTRLSAEWRRPIQEALEAAREGRSQRLHHNKSRSRALYFLYFFWILVALSHILAEMSLINWLASSERKPYTGLAEFVSLTANIGFFSILIGAFVERVMAFGDEKRRRQEMLDEIQQLRSSRMQQDRTPEELSSSAS